jgi:hypothetical protein
LNISHWNGANLTGLENYVAVEAEGCGQMVGLHLQVDNLGGGWWGEGDDMIFVDGERGRQWPPTYPGTGTEEVFGGGASPSHAYSGPYTGFHMVEYDDYAGKNAMYRWYLVDPVRFRRSLVWTIEHGHDNCYRNDYTSVAYWYQMEPHAPFPRLASIEARLPRFSEDVLKAESERARCRTKLIGLREANAGDAVVASVRDAFVRGLTALKEGRAEDALAAFAAID